MKRLVFWGEIKNTDGVKPIIDIPEKQIMAQMAWESFGAVKVKVTITPEFTHKEAPLIKYYFARLLPLVTKAHKENGNDDITEKEMHLQLKELFLAADKNGKKSLSNRGQPEFREYINRCERLACTFYNLDLTDIKGLWAGLKEPC